jgi:hypothetical protein
MSGKTKHASHMSVLLAAGLIGCVIAGPAFSAPDCTCRYQGQKVSQGETACLRTQKGMVLARCGMSQNNTSWIFLDTPCPTASNGIMPGNGMRSAFASLAMQRLDAGNGNRPDMCMMPG